MYAIRYTATDCQGKGVISPVLLTVLGNQYTHTDCGYTANETTHHNVAPYFAIVYYDRSSAVATV